MEQETEHRYDFSQCIAHTTLVQSNWAKVILAAVPRENFPNSPFWTSILPVKRSHPKVTEESVLFPLKHYIVHLQKQLKMCHPTRSALDNIIELIHCRVFLAVSWFSHSPENKPQILSGTEKREREREARSDLALHPGSCCQGKPTDRGAQSLKGAVSAFFEPSRGGRRNQQCSAAPS